MSGVLWTPDVDHPGHKRIPVVQEEELSRAAKKLHLGGPGDERSELVRVLHRDHAVPQSVNDLRGRGPLTSNHMLSHLRPQGNKCFIYSPVK